MLTTLYKTKGHVLSKDGEITQPYWAYWMTSGVGMSYRLRRGHGKSEWEITNVK